jgi:hypothetical protein
MEDFERHHPGFELEAVTFLMIQDFLSSFGDPLPAKTNLKKACLRSFFYWHHDAGYLDMNSGQMVQAEKISIKEAPLSQSEIGKFGRAIKGDPSVITGLILPLITDLRFPPCNSCY